jgi:hypothetical protein
MFDKNHKISLNKLMLLSIITVVLTLFFYKFDLFCIVGLGFPGS